MIMQLLVVLFIPCVAAFSKSVPIVGLFDDDDEMIKKAFSLSVKYVNRNRYSNEELSNIYLNDESIIIDSDIVETTDKVCGFLQKGIVGIFGPQDADTAMHVQSLCDTFEMPHITVRWDPDQVRGRVNNLYPQPEVLSTLYYEVVKAFAWKSYMILYDSSDSLIRAHRLLKRWDAKGYTITIQHVGPGPNYRHLMKALKQSSIENIIIDVSYQILEEVLTQALQVGILSEKHRVIVTSLDFPTIDMEPFRYSGANFTTFRMVDPEDAIVKEIFNTSYLDWGVTDLSKLNMNAALMFDAVQLFARALKQLDDAVKADVKEISCNETESWEHGTSLFNFIRLSEMRGLTGLIKFDTEGFRSNIQIDVMQLDFSGYYKTAVWNTTNGFEWIPKPIEPELNGETSLRNRTFIVLISLTEPYAMLKESTSAMRDNDRFEGFAIDIIEHLSQKLGFNYTFVVQEDKIYGSKKPNSQEWNGMLRKIIDGEADLAITDLTITSERESAVDFTMPFMNLGISILYHKPKKAPPSPFSFLSPFSNKVWLYLLGTFTLVSLLLFVTGRLSPAEWTNPYPCIEEPEELENQFTLKNSFWFTMGAIMQQGSEIAPIGVSTRMIASLWWFFCLIIVSSYTANLAAFLTVETIVRPIKNVEDLANQDKIKYGAKKDGSTIQFFRDANHTTYRNIYKYMMDPANDVLVNDNEKGIDKVLYSDYAFFMESSSIEYQQQRKCNISQIGDLLDNKGYGIAMRKNAPYRNTLSSAVLQLQEAGILTKLKKTWWEEKREGGKCNEEAGSGAAAELDLDNVGGVFLVLSIGVAVSILYTLAEFLWDIGCTSLREDVPFLEELKEEVKFVIKFSGSSKPVRRRKRSSSRNTEESGRECSPTYGFVPTVITTPVGEDN